MKWILKSISCLDSPLKPEYRDTHLNKPCEVTGDSESGFFITTSGGVVETILKPVIKIDPFGNIEISGFALDTIEHYCRLSVIISVP